MLWNSRKGRSGVENNHFELESEGLVFFVLLWHYIAEEVSKAIVEPNPLQDSGLR